MSAACCVVTAKGGRCGAKEHLGWYKLGDERAGAEHAIWLGSRPKFQRGGDGGWEHDVGLHAEDAAVAVRAKPAAAESAAATELNADAESAATAESAAAAESDVDAPESAAAAAESAAAAEEEEAMQLSAALDESMLSHALEESVREESVAGTEGEGEGRPSALTKPAEGDYVLIGSETLTDLLPGKLLPHLRLCPCVASSAPAAARLLLHLPIDHSPQP